MKKYIYAVTAIVTIIVLAVFLTQPHHQPIYQQGYTAPNMQFPHFADDHTVYFFTGSAFAAYDTHTHNTKTLSAQVSLPILSAVRWSKTGVLFKTGNSTSVDDLYPASRAFLLDQSQEYWWRYDFATNRISLLHTGNHSDKISDAQWDDEDGKEYVYTIGNSLYRSNGAIIFKNDSNITNLNYANNQTYIYESTNDKGTTIKVFSIATGAQNLVTAIMRDVVVNKGGRFLTYVTNFNAQSSGVTPGDLYLFDRQTGKSKKLTSQYTGVVSSNDESLLLISNQPPSQPVQVMQFNLDSQKLSILTGDIAHLSALPTSVFSLGPNDLALVSQTNLLSLFNTSTTLPITTPDNTAAIQGDYYMDGFNINYRLEAGVDTYYIYITKNPYFQYQLTAIDYIRKQKIDPNLIRIKWYRNDGVAVDRVITDVSVPANYFISADEGKK